MKIEYYNNFNEIEEDWDKLYTASSLSYFCSTQWHRVVLGYLKKSYFTKILYKIQYFTVSEKAGGEVVLCGFFYVSRFRKKKELIFYHLLGPSDYYDFIYRDGFSIINPEEIIRSIGEKYKAKTINTTLVREDSLVARIFKKLKSSPGLIGCVAINLPSNYELFFKNLSNNGKQNIRTRYNRLKRNEISYEFQLYYRKDSKNIDFKKLIELYNLRNTDRKYKDLSWKFKIYYSLNYFFKGEPDLFEIKEALSTDFTIGILRLNNEIAAYFFGYNRNGFIEINRVVYKQDYKFYSPGIILFNEYIKSEIENGLKVVDLTNGTERYKFDLGGELYNVLNFNL